MPPCDFDARARRALLCAPWIISRHEITERDAAAYAALRVARCCLRRYAELMRVQRCAASRYAVTARRR